MGTVRQQVGIVAGTRDVWRALTTGEGVARWWATEARVDARDGGLIVLVEEDAEGRREQRGLFHEVRPVRKIELALDHRGGGPDATSRVCFTVARDGDETRVAMTASAAAWDDEAVRQAADQRWKVRLEKLRGVLEG